MDFYVGMFLGVIIGTLAVLLFIYITNLQNALFESRRELNLERCAKWYNTNVEHKSRVRRNLRDKAQDAIGFT